MCNKPEIALRCFIAMESVKRIIPLELKTWNKGALL